MGSSLRTVMSSMKRRRSGLMGWDDASMVPFRHRRGRLPRLQRRQPAAYAEPQRLHDPPRVVTAPYRASGLVRRLAEAGWKRNSKIPISLTRSNSRNSGLAAGSVRSSTERSRPGWRFLNLGACRSSQRRWITSWLSLPPLAGHVRPAVTLPFGARRYRWFSGLAALPWRCAFWPATRAIARSAFDSPGRRIPSMLFSGGLR